MYCDQLDRLLQTHSTLTMEYFRQDARTQEFYASDEEWVAECKRLQALEEDLERVVAAVAEHRRQHGCDAPNVGLDVTTEDTEQPVSGHDFSRAEGSGSMRALAPE